MRSSIRPTRVVFGLLLCGVVAIAVRFYAQMRAGLEDDGSVWRLTYAIAFEAERSGSELRVASPADTPFCRVVRQDFRQENLRTDPRGRSSTQAREIIALAEEPGPSEATFRFDLRLNPKGQWSWHTGAVVLTADERFRYLRSETGIQADDPDVMAILAELRNGISDRATLAHAIFTHCHRNILSGKEGAAEDAATVLRSSTATSLGCVRAMIALCRAARIPARPVTGFIIDAREPVTADIWLEILLDDEWISYDPVNGYEKTLPYHYVPARRGDDRVVIAAQAPSFEIAYAITRLPRATLGAGAVRGNSLEILDLTRLPLETQTVLSLVLLMPLGALVTSVFRNLVGLRTSGTFTPTLLALSFVLADWRTGLVLLSAAVVLGIATRYLIERLNLLLLPRLSIMLALVVLCIVFGISALAYGRMTLGVQAVLLPVVILTMLIERFYLTTREEGVLTAARRFGATIVVGFFCYVVFRWEALGALLLAYPEAHLFTIALLVLVGRYTGYQLFELWRFREFAGKEPV
jgi:transglutaminase-like putative cysteine protease